MVCAAGHNTGEFERMLGEQCFGGTTKDNVLDMGARVSRKKDFMPPITHAIARMSHAGFYCYAGQHVHYTESITQGFGTFLRNRLPAIEPTSDCVCLNHEQPTGSKALIHDWLI
jgi:hypothetical protein